MIKRLLPKIFIAVLLLVSGGLWLANGLGVPINFPFNAFWPTVIAGIGIAFLIGTFCFNSKGYLYFFGFFTSFGSIFLTAHYMGGFSNLKLLWPLLIACPGIASLIMFFVRNFSLQHIKFALLFIGVATGLFLANSGIVQWEIMIPMVVVLVGIILLANVIFRRSKSWDMADNEINNIPCDDEDDKNE